MQVLTRTSVEKLLASVGLAGASLIVEPLSEAPPGAPLRMQAHAEIYPASMVKTPLAAAVLWEAAQGRLSLDDRCEVTAANMTANDAASPLAPGYAATVGELIDLALTRSDNVATNLLFDVVGRSRATEIAQRELGLPSTAFHRKLSGADPLIEDPAWDGVHRNAHPPADAARLFGAIARRTIPYAEELEAILERQAWNDKLSAGLRPGDRFAHKTGDTSTVTHDGGILTTAEGRRYVLVVYTQLSSSAEHDAGFAALMRELLPAL